MPDPPRLPEGLGLGEEELIELLIDRLVDYKAHVFVEDPAAVPRGSPNCSRMESYAVPHGIDQALLADSARR